jgi:virginiamycin B lyase
MTIVYSAAVKRAAIFVALCGLCAGLAGHGSAAIVEFPILSSLAEPEGITCGPDGAYWFVEFAQSRIGRIDTNGVVTEYATPSGISHPFDIVNGGDGSNLWFTESSYSQVGRINTNGVIQEFPLPYLAISTGITLGPDGRLWLLDFGQEYIPGAPTNGGVGALTLSNGVVTGGIYYNANLTIHSRPFSITSGPDGNLYFTEQFTGKIGRITTNGIITEATVNPTNGQPFDITTGPDGAIWFTEANTNALGRIDTSNFTNVMLLSLPANNSGGTVLDQPNGIVTGKDGNLYYTDSPAGIIGRVTLNGTNPPTVAQFYTPTTNANPWLVATGPDSNIWFGEFQANQIGKFLMAVPLSIQFVSNQVFISWTTNVGTNFVLEDNTGFNPTNWMVLTNIPVANTNTGLFTVDFVPTNNPPTNTLFFRLID